MKTGSFLGRYVWRNGTEWWRLNRLMLSKSAYESVMLKAYVLDEELVDEVGSGLLRREWTGLKPQCNAKKGRRSCTR